MPSGNRGEWSEIYTFLKLLKDKKIYAADKNLNKISENMFFPIIKIRREEIQDEIYDYHTGDTVKIYYNNSLIKEINSKIFKEYSEFLFNELFHLKKGNLKSEDISSFNNFLKDIFVTKIKVGSNKKADIVMEIIDIHTGYNPLIGFSIKSQIGSPATLLNASQATNFIYKITGINDNVMNEVNSINDKQDKIIKRFNKLYKFNANIIFQKMENLIFQDNLEMIDSKMPDILSHVLIYRYKNNLKNFKDIVNKLCDDNPMNYHNKNIYGYKIKKLLCSSALGMLPATKWDGTDQANGGYIIVKNNGDILAYYIYNRNAFEDYLLNSTYLEAASTSRNNYANIYKKDEEYFINMNLQIRFKA